ncbi:MAG: ParB/RepB/Spo0J family partition protein [Planctomycetes bacterium]|nr:ParB/RepB/Spo0J family partition protein [Planctomycetota bacterium]
MISKIRELPLKEIFANPDQPRKKFDKTKLEELAMSIKEYGIIEPIIVTPRDGRYMIIAGERRFRASKIAGLPKVLSVVKGADDDLAEEIALLENIQREDLNIIEEAEAYQSLLDRGMPKETLAKKMGFKQPWRIDERTSLLKLTRENQQLVIKGTIGNSQAFEMSRLPHSKQSTVLRKIQSGSLNTYNKLRAYVDGMIALESQANLLTLTSITLEEKETMRSLESVLQQTEKFIKVFQETENLESLKKVAFHTSITADRIDLIIQILMKVRKKITEGSGIKSAMQEAN